MAMSPEVQAEYDRALTAVVVEHGTIVKERPSIYGWIDYNALDHIGQGWRTPQGTCALIVPENAHPREDRWVEFAGTFAEDDNSRTGVAVDGVSCRCGQLTNRTVRWDAHVQEVAEAVFTKAVEQRAGG